MSDTLSTFRIVALEYAKETDETVEKWIELTKPLVSKKQFGSVYEQALALLTAHRMKMAGVGIEPTEDALADVNSIGMGGLMRVGSYSEGSVSISFGQNASSLSQLNAELGLTEYGVQYLTLRRMRVIPLTLAGG